MTKQTEEIPTQRGTSSGEIGQNPVEIIGKHPAPSDSEPVYDPTIKKQDPGSKN